MKMIKSNTTHMLIFRPKVGTIILCIIDYYIEKLQYTYMLCPVLRPSDIEHNN